MNYVHFEAFGIFVNCVNKYENICASNRKYSPCYKTPYNCIEMISMGLVGGSMDEFCYVEF